MLQFQGGCYEVASVWLGPLQSFHSCRVARERELQRARRDRRRLGEGDAVGAAQEGLAQAIHEFGAKHKDAKLRISAQQVKPLPYWRDKVTDDLLLKPDIVTPKSYTVCWKGVVSHVVCTSGSKVCW
jgi:hypothetical protein